MNQLIGVLACSLVPFFLQAEVTNIFEDGTVILIPAESQLVPRTKCFSTHDGTHPSNTIGKSSCHSWISGTYSDARYSADTSWYSKPYHYRKALFCEPEEINEVIDDCSTWISVPRLGYWLDLGDEVSIPMCPPENNDAYSYFVGSGDDTKCADPAQINLVDACNVNATAEYLPFPAPPDAEIGCFTTSNGSICQYNPVEINGVTAYGLDLEGDCYSNPQPDIEGTEQPTPESSEDMCQPWGGTGMICPENPEDHCTGGSNYAGGAMADCEVGCGEVNGIFTCIDNDLDADGLPDYLDPDIDGDGIINGDDIDSNGDGQDDPIPNGGNGSNAEISVDVEIDLSPVVNKLEEINKSLSQTNVPLNQSPTDNATSFYTSQYENGLQGIWDETKIDFENSEFIVFLNTFKEVPGGGAAASSQMCFNLGAMGNFGCGELTPSDSRIWAAIRIFILVTAGFLCRAILFGG